MAETGLVFHPLFLEHDTGRGHPERAARLHAVMARLRDSGLREETVPLEPAEITPEAVAVIHDPRLVEIVRAASSSVQAGGGVALDGDTIVSAASYRAALAAAGGAVQAVDRVLSGDWGNAFVACRPPGHHAETRRSMGFCLFNNAALAAAHARRVHGVERVVVLDWDVHHGNGTQEIFEADPTVLYVSLHQWPWYPGTGSARERGVGDGDGATLNVEMDSGAGDTQYLDALERVVLPEIERFDPGLIIISAGFDAHLRDPLSGTRVTTDGYRRMSGLVAEVAAARCSGRIVSLLEGGYDLDALAASVEAHVGELRAAG